MEFKHTETGKIYAYEGVGKMKMLSHHDDQPSNDFSSWVDCVFYSREGHVYCREITDFFEHFEKAVLGDNDLAPCETSNQ